MMECALFLSRWRMPLLFFVSGIGTFIVLKRVHKQKILWQRTKRLLLPSLFGMLVIVPAQVYFERIYKGAHYKSFFDFYPSIFTTTVYPKGNSSWHYLWFVAYLFVNSVFAVPIVLYFKSNHGQKVVSSVASFAARFGMISFGIILFAASLLYFWYPNETHAFVDDWAGFTKYFLYFIFGAFIGVNPIFWAHIESSRRQNFKITFFGTILVNYFRWNNVEPTWGMNVPNLLFFALNVINAWFWVITFLGYAKKYLNFTNKFLQLSNEAIYPFYILHQTFIVVIAYYIIQVKEDILTKYLFLTLVSFVLSVGLYVFLIRPYKLTRLLFGMKIKK